MSGYDGQPNSSCHQLIIQQQAIDDFETFIIEVISGERI
jgi:hypothetical protein